MRNINIYNVIIIIRKLGRNNLLKYIILALLSKVEWWCSMWNITI